MNSPRQVLDDPRICPHGCAGVSVTYCTDCGYTLDALAADTEPGELIRAHWLR